MPPGQLPDGLMLLAALGALLILFAVVQLSLVLIEHLGKSIGRLYAFLVSDTARLQRQKLVERGLGPTAPESSTRSLVGVAGDAYPNIDYPCESCGEPAGAQCLPECPEWGTHTAWAYRTEANR